MGRRTVIPSDQPAVEIPVSQRADDMDSDVLVVDDDSANLAMIEAVLEGLGIRVTTAGSGEDALRQIVRHSFAVILLDVNLPGMNGFETAKLIRTRDRSKRVPIIFITGHSQHHHDVQRGYELGAVDYLFKPVAPTVLRAKVKVFVDLHQQTLEVARQAEMLRQAEGLEAGRKLEEERRRWEAEELRQQVRHERLVNEQLSEADRRKDEFIALLAHELRNPLMPLVMGLRLIAARGSDEPLVQETRAKMERHVRHLKRLVDDLTDIARIRRGKLEMNRVPIDLAEVIEHARDMCSAVLARRRQHLTIEGIEHTVTLHADPVRLTQVVSNLLNNASRYSPPGSRIWMRWGIENDRVFMRVLDEGQGIDAHFIERVFDPFSQARKGHLGLGLGLTLVRQIVEKHGGTVEASSRGPGHGSEFVVMLPSARVSELVVTSSSTAEEHPAGTSSLRVVLVEDCVDIRDLVGHLVEEWGHTVVGAVGTGQEAVEHAIRQHPDVVIVDIDLPDFDGYEVARRIRTELGDQRPGLVAVSGYGPERAQQLAFDAGFDAMLVKPPDPEVLREVLEEVCRPRSTARHEGRRAITLH